MTLPGVHPAPTRLTPPPIRFPIIGLDNYCQNIYCHIMLSFGEYIRTLRLEKNVPLRVVAAAVEIDSTLLSRFELGDRFPTDEQIKRFADYFQQPVEEFSAQVIADRILSSYGHDAVMLKAADIVKERIAAYTAHKDEK